MPSRIVCAPLVAFIVLTCPVFGQVQVEERPQVLKVGKALSAEETERQKTEELNREARTLFGLGVLRERADRLLDAMQLLEEVVKIDPEVTPPRRALVAIYLAVGRDKEALEACQAVLERDPADYETAFSQYKIFKTTGRVKEAAESLKLGIASKRVLDRPERLLVMLNELAAIQEQAGEDSAAEASQRRLVQTLTDRREALLLSGEIKGAEIDANIASLHERIGRCCLKQKKHEAALDAFIAARDTFARNPDPQAQLQANRLNWNLCEVSWTQEKWESALTFLDAYLQQQPAGIEPYERKLELLKRLGRTKEIVPAARKAAERDPHHVGLQLMLARELGRESRTQREAEALYLKLLERYPSPDTFRGLFKLFHAANRPAGTIDLIDGAIKVVADKAESRPAELRETAAERLRAMLAVVKDDSVLTTSLLATAIKEIDERGQTPTRALQTWTTLGSLAVRARQLDKAERLFRECLRFASGNSDLETEAQFGLIEVCFLAHKYRDAAALCREILDGTRKPRPQQESHLRRFLALALCELDKLGEAVDEVDRAIKVATTEETKFELRRDRARILSEAGQHDEAVAECKAMLQESMQSTHVRSARFALSVVYMNQRQFEKSEEQLRLILDLDPNDPLTCNNLGYQMADRGHNLDEAEKLIRRAIELDRLQRRLGENEPGNATYLDSLGWVLFRKGQLNEANRWLETAVALPEGAEVGELWDHLGDVRLKLNEPAKARQAWETAVKHYQQDRRAKKEGRLDAAKRKLKLLEVSSDR